MKFYLEHLSMKYNDYEVYSLASKLGDKLSDFLGEDLFCMLLDTQIIFNDTTLISSTKDKSFILHPAALVLESFLEKIICRKQLKKEPDDSIGLVFGKKDDVCRQKIKNPKLISKVKATWDFCRNDVMHYPDSKNITVINYRTRFCEILEVITLVYESFYSKSPLNEQDKMKFHEILTNEKLKIGKKSYHVTRDKNGRFLDLRQKKK